MNPLSTSIACLGLALACSAQMKWVEKRPVAKPPALRATPPMADGSRHLYHANDTHLNARGNDLVAHLLANFLIKLEKGQSPK